MSNWQPGTLWGLSLKFGVPQSNVQKTYTICVDPAASTVTFIRPNASNAYGTGREMIRCMKFTNTAISIDLFINDDILDVCFSDGHVLTLRLDHHVQYGISVSAFSFAGTIDLS